MTPKQIETYLLLHEQKVESFVKSRSRNWLIAAGIAFIILIVLLIVVFRHKSSTNEAYESRINTLDSLVKYQQKTIDALQLVNRSQDSIISNLDEKYKANRPIETRIIHSYERIPFDVNSYSREELRKQVTNY